MPPLLAFWPLSVASTALVVAAATPILIHLWNRQFYQQTRWAAMEYLLAAMKKHASRMQLEQLIVLLLRVAILVVAAIAVTDPSFSCRWSGSLGSSLGAAGRRHTVIVIDGSYSMNYTVGEKSRFDRAKELAEKRVEEGTQGDGYTLLLMTDVPRTIIAEPAFNPQDVTQELGGLKQPHTGASLLPTLAEARRLIVSARERHPRLDEVHVLFLTDLGRNTWREVATPDGVARLGELAEAATRLELVDVGQENTVNLALTSLDQVEAYATAGREITFRVGIQNFATAEQSPSIEFYVDDRQIASEAAKVAPGGRATAQFTYRFEQPGDHLVEARLKSDALDVDNHRWLAVQVRESVNVLAIGGRQSDTFFLRRVLQPRRDERPALRVQEVSESALLETDLTQYDAVFVSNVGRIGKDEAAVFRDYLQHGGGLIFFLGDSVQPESYNQQLADPQAATPVLPARLKELVSGADLVIDPRDYASPIVAPFRGYEKAGLLSTPVWRYYRLEPLPDSPVALGIERDPLIVTHRWPRGGCVLVATAASTGSLDRSTTPPTPWTLLPTWGSFGPLTHEMLAWSIRPRFADRSVIVGQPLAGSLRRAGPEAAVRIGRPNGTSERVRLISEGSESRWEFTQTDLSGRYEAMLEGQTGPPQLFVANVNTVESDLTRLAPEELPASLQTGVEAAPVGPELSSSRKWELFRLLLGLVLVLVCAETFLAWFFGSRAR